MRNADGAAQLMWDGEATQNAGDALCFASESNEARRARGQRTARGQRYAGQSLLGCYEMYRSGMRRLLRNNCDETEELQRTAAPSASANDSDENDDDVAEAALLAKMREARVNGRKSGS